MGGSTVSVALLSLLMQSGQPWLSLRANSEQRQPVYLGATPLELSRGEPGPSRLTLPSALRPLGDRLVARVRLPVSATELEAWPAQDDFGVQTWAFARWRSGPAEPWQWVDGELMASPRGDTDPDPFVPRSLRPGNPTEFHEIFDDFLLLNDLYAKPVFGDCLWTDALGEITAAWLNPDDRATDANRWPGAICRILPQPARWNGAPLSIVLRLRSGQIAWPDDIQWQEEVETSGEVSPLVTGKPSASQAEAALEQDFKNDVLSLDGEGEAVFPLSGQSARFTRRSSADVGNQLPQVVQYLEERYSILGISTWRDSFSWRGIPETNLIAVIPGTENLPPVLLGDHIDTAFDEDVFAHSRARVAAPGADDNATATAAMLQAAVVLKELHLRSPVWLVSLTGEEFPGDDLGARHLVSRLLSEKRGIAAMVLMDMIGVRKGADPIFQISPGRDFQSKQVAKTVAAAARAVSPELSPTIRWRQDPKSYLYNTDGLIFADAGLPTVLVNERLNAYENIDRKGYHDSTDLSYRIDWGYARGIARAVTRAVEELAR